MSVRSRRTSALLFPALLLATACGTGVEITSTGLSGDERAACEALVADLPETLFDQERVETTGEGLGAAWGDPAVVLTCGAAEPEAFDAWARCSEIDGIGWYVPDAQIKDPESDVVMTAQSHSPRVSLEIPGEHRFNGPDGELRALATPMAEHLEEIQPCQ